MKLISMCPSNNFELIGEVKETSEKEVIEAIRLAKSVQKTWNNINVEKRINILKGLHLNLEKNKTKIVEMISKEMGKPILQAENEVSSTLKYIKWDLENVKQILQDEVTFEDDKEIQKVVYEAKGIVCIISPFNYPFSLACSTMIQNLLIGNVVINKPDPSTPLLYKLLEEIFKQSELPDGIQQFIYGGSKIGEFLINQDIDMICFTGSSSVGKHIYSVAASKMIPVVMELGGSAPGIVFEDADLDKVIDGIFKKRFSNTGQLCHALKRLIVHENIFEDVVDRLKLITERQILGDYTNRVATMGSLSNQKQYDKIIEQYNDAINKGANLICGGKKPQNLNGLYFEPTILTNITTDMKIWNEEVFGPILPIVSFKTIDEAINLSNDTKYGLGGYVFTQNMKNYNLMSKELKTGMVACNNSTYLGAHNPFGGIKLSGIGRTRGKWGFHEFCNIKVISYEKF